MNCNDGHRLLTTAKGTVSVSCSRWDELMDAMKFHTSLAEISGCVTEFRLLNGSPPVVNDGPHMISRTQLTPLSSLLIQVVGSPDGGVGLVAMQQAMSRPPGGKTPLCRHIREVITKIQGLESQLRANCHKAVVVIATVCYFCFFASSSSCCCS